MQLEIIITGTLNGSNEIVLSESVAGDDGNVESGDGVDVLEIEGTESVGKERSMRSVTSEMVEINSKYRKTNI